ncbi:MAG: hypothetical protein FD159_971 [Syntrophaceae bacterium]|nr:MAG: hypothetical protein FD159_971 [Syntrophaceae bacterium]
MAQFDEREAMNRNNAIKIVLSILILMFSGLCFAADVQQSEINHLLQYIERTNCKQERNGTEYSGAEAVAHVQKKYAYFKDKIHGTEEFIMYSATKSEVSGKPYTVHCPGQPAINSRDWLLKELSRFRQKK